MCRGVAEREPVSVSSRAVDLIQVDHGGGGEDEDGAAGRDGLEWGGRSAENGGIDRAVRSPSRAFRVRVDGEDVVAAASEHLREEPADEALADDEHAPSRHPLGTAQHTGQRLDVGARRVVDRTRKGNPLGRRHLLREAAGTMVAAAKASQVDS
jgi:hypothetical protein